MNPINNQISHICVKKIDLVLLKYIKLNILQMNFQEIETELGLELPNNFQNYTQTIKLIVVKSI